MTEVVPIFNEPAQGLAFVSTKMARRIHGALEYCMNEAKLGLITGEPGVGKTTALERFVEVTPRTMLITMNGALRSTTTALSHIYEHFQLYPVRRMDHLYAGIVSGLERRHTRLVILDEAQQLSDHALDVIRSIYDKINVPFVFSGNMDFRDRCNNLRAGFGQFASRIGMRVSAEYPDRSDINLICQNDGITEASARAFLFDYSQSGGALRTVGDLIVKAIDIAGGGAAVRIDHLQLAIAALGVEK